MAARKAPERVWAVVEVQSGIPVRAEVYADEQSARVRERNIRRSMNPENDETCLFNAEVVCGRRASSAERHLK